MDPALLQQLPVQEVVQVPDQAVQDPVQAEAQVEVQVLVEAQVQDPVQVEAEAQVQVQPNYPTPLQKLSQVTQLQKKVAMPVVDITQMDTGYSQSMMLTVMQ